jgi:hypothetical protein
MFAYKDAAYWKMHRMILMKNAASKETAFK